MLVPKLLVRRHCFRLPRILPQACLRLCHGSAAATEQPPPPKMLVYEGDYQGKLRLLKVLSCGSTACCLSMLPKMTAKIGEHSPHFAATIMAGGLLLLALSTPLLLHWVASGYVIRMRFEPNMKAFEIDTLDFFARTKTTTFKQEDISFPDMLGPFSTVMIKGDSFLINFNQIMDADVFDHFMKYDKPMEFEMEPEATTSDTKPPPP